MSFGESDWPVAADATARRCALHRVRLEAFLRRLRRQHRMSARSGVGTYLAIHPGRIVPMAELVEWVYGEREDGGALAPEACIHSAVYLLRRSGFPIVTYPGRGYSLEEK